MKVCITSQGNSIDSNVDPRFGRCSYFIIIDTDSMDYSAVQNDQVGVTGGAGVQSGKLVSENDAETVITGSVGPNAFQTLEAAGINVITGASGSVKDTFEKFKKGELKTVSSPDSGAKSGMEI